MKLMPLVFSAPQYYAPTQDNLDALLVELDGALFDLDPFVHTP